LASGALQKADRVSKQSSTSAGLPGVDGVMSTTVVSTWPNFRLLEPDA
jgi:hypothetical protein